MQSTGQACTHSSSFVQLSVMTYAIWPSRMQFPCHAQVSEKKTRKSTVPQTWVGHSPQLRNGTLAEMKIETRAIHAGRRIDPATAAVTPPIHLSTTFKRTAGGD